MTYQEILEKMNKEPVKVKKKYRDAEHRIQADCVRWFRLQHAEFGNLLFAIPNGGRRDKATAGKLKVEGVVAGVADMMLALPKFKDERCLYHGLFIEMKTEDKASKQRASQKKFEALVTMHKYKYNVCRSLDEFIKTIEEYVHK